MVEAFAVAPRQLWVYPGPMGAVLTPSYIGLEQALDLPQAATLCGACSVVCPVSESPEAASGENPRPIRIAPVTATGVPKPEAPSKKAPKANAIRSSCRRRSAVT